MSPTQLSARPALLFDLDGTLVDSVYQHVLAWREALHKEAFDLSFWRLHRRIGMSGGLLLRTLDRELGRSLNHAEAERLPVSRGGSAEADGSDPSSPRST